MPDDRRKTCRYCGKTNTEVGPISWRGKCAPCGRRAMNAMHDHLKEHRGPGFDYWRERVAAGVGGVLLYDPPPNT